MPNDSDQSPPRRRRTDKQVELAEELYRLADQVCASSSETSREGQQRKKWARRRLKREISIIVEQDGLRPSAANHRWIVDALDDIADYAERNGMTVLFEYLRDTHFLVLEILNMHHETGQPLRGVSADRDDAE